MTVRVRLVAVGPLSDEFAREQVGRYLVEYDAKTRVLTTAESAADARGFASMREALTYVDQPGDPPFRPDGKRNRPLLAYTLEFDSEEVSDAEEGDGA